MSHRAAEDQRLVALTHLRQLLVHFQRRILLSVLGLNQMIGVEFINARVNFYLKVVLFLGIVALRKEQLPDVCIARREETMMIIT